MGSAMSSGPRAGPIGQEPNRDPRRIHERLTWWPSPNRRSPPEARDRSGPVTVPSQQADSGGRCPTAAGDMDTTPAVRSGRCRPHARLVQVRYRPLTPELLVLDLADRVGGRPEPHPRVGVDGFAETGA